MIYVYCTLQNNPGFYARVISNYLILETSYILEMHRNILLVTLLLLASGFCRLEAADWKQLVDLRGMWSFTVGDDPLWAQPSANTGDWDALPVPGDWERYYQGYNGYAWYRRTFTMPTISSQQDIILLLGSIDDVDEVFLNGKKIGQTGKFPPNFVTAYSVERQYRVSKNLLNTGENVIAVRVYDETRGGGFIRGDKIGFYIDRNVSFLEFNLSGDWKFSTDTDWNFKNPSFDDQHWETVYVPASWESQGYEDYDGYGYYRKQFNLPAEFTKNGNYLIMGKIDDTDRVYLNGQLIGQVEDMTEYSRFNRSNAYRLYRIYRIPDDLLRNKNVIAVEVMDNMGVGGIYEGPVGILSRDRMLRFRENILDETGEDNPLRIIFKLLFE
ncbi:MAG TPA: glycoside hydrolase [Prolixibacteraceae bacterium]|nr:glycoside hydrolase [Prolixibacteraceae bacterium]HCR90870.1 glycoside hydrolase [Prolixibacteraceae bacterium]HCU61944.1 glycoside hydrolase [Prolixibacteraceae bacterium]